jgi:hypothetical protein
MKIRVSDLSPKAKERSVGGFGRTLGLALYLVSVLAAQSANAVDGQCASRADLWFANDESGSVDATEFEGALNFIYQVADSFEYDASTGAQAGIIGWADELQPTDVIVPITEDFGDVDDVGLVGSLTTDGDGKGVRELYTARVSGSNGTRLDLATQRLAQLINGGNGARAGVPSVAVILTDANQGQLEQWSRGGGGAWIKAAENLRAAGPDGTQVVVMVIDNTATRGVANAALAYTDTAGAVPAAGTTITNTTDLDGYAEYIVNTVAGSADNVYVGATYAEIADPTQGFISGFVNKV